jgi:hypothetical protein
MILIGLCGKIGSSKILKNERNFQPSRKGTTVLPQSNEPYNLLFRYDISQYIKTCIIGDFIIQKLALAE